MNAVSAARTRSASAAATWYSSRYIANRRGALVISRADSSACAAPPSLTSKSAGLSVSIARPRASAAMTSMETMVPPGAPAPRSRGVGGPCAPAGAAATITAASAISARDAKPKQLLRLAAFAGRLDLEDVFARHHPGEGQLELLIARLRRGGDGDLGHRLARAVEQMHRQRRGAAARSVRRNADQQTVRAQELARRDRNRIRIRLQLRW